MNRTPLDKAQDEELIRRYVRGDAGVFPELYGRYKNKILLMVRGFFFNPEKAEEIFQEVFLKAIERLPSFDGSGSFKSWLFALCRNHCIDRLRGQARRPELTESQFMNDDGENLSPISKAASPDPGADESAYRRELAQGIQHALKKLPEEQRETFLLKETGGLTFEEIGEITEVSINTVKSRMRYALEGLRRALKDKHFVKEAL